MSSIAEKTENISTTDLIGELRRRVRCAEKTQKTMTVLVGPPGSGKGTSAPRIRADYCTCHIATGDALREAQRLGTPMGKAAAEVMARGDLVSDDIVVGIIKEKIQQPECAGGFILDGFPRTLKQAAMLDAILAKDGGKIQSVLNFDIADSVLVDRIVGRRVHPASGRSYHVKFNPPKVEGKDDITGESLIHRKDDTEEALKNRLTQFHNQTKPILDHYKEVVAKIDADKPIEHVYSQVVKALGAFE